MYRWLNDYSQQFLDKDYLLPGQTVDERVDIICNGAEKILNIPGFAARFKENFQKGWYSLSTPIWTNFATDRGLPISCVTGDTWINTRFGGGKQARDIEIGDEVLTHKGRYRTVSDIIITDNRKGIFKLKVCNRMTPIYLTGDHLVLTNLGWVRADALNPDMHLVAINRQLEIPAETNDYLIDFSEFSPEGYIEHEGKIKKEGSLAVRKDRRVDFVSYTAQIINNIVFDEELAWAFGLWFAEGSLTRDKSGKPNGIRITVNNNDEIEKANKWLEIISRRFNLNGNGYESYNEERGSSWYSINVNSLILGSYFASFGDNCKNKIIPQFIIESKDSFLDEFLRGILGGDGTLYTNGNNKITLSNPRLILQVYQIGLKLGYQMSLQMQDKAGKLSSTSHVYTVYFRPYVLGKNKNYSNNVVAFSDGLNYAPIRCIEPTEKQETVYDFTVEEDHSFSAAGVILHNCFGSHISDNMSSILSTHAEVGMMCKNGGGTSAYFGELRPRGSKIKNNGESFGSVHFMRLFDSLINIVSQGSCYVQGTEVLTNKGFKLFEDVLESDKLAQVDEYNNVSFTSEFESVVNDFEGDLVVFKGLKKEDAVSIKVTPNHRMVVCKRKMKNRKRYWSNKTEIVEAQDLSMHRDNRFILGAWAGDGEGLSLQDRLRIAFQADGIKDGDNRKIRFHFSKKRKISRMVKLLSDAQIPFEVYDNLDESTLISLEYDSNLKFEKFENWIEIEKVSGTWAEQFIDELSCWDGSVNHGGSINYSSVIKNNVDIVQSIAALANRKTRTRVRKAYDNKQDLHYVTISNKSYRSGDAVNISKEYYKGKVYCAIVPEGRLIVRYNGRVMVCGNTRRGNFAAYLPTDHKDINEFLTIRKEGSPLQDILSGVCVSDEWMQSMIDGDTEKRTIWARVLESRTNTGFPYIFFTDNVNNNTVDVYKDKKLKITHSNMCVTGEQRVVSDRGLLTAKELYEQGGELTLFDNKKSVKASSMQLIEKDADVYKITLENGMTHTITSYHKISTSNGIKQCSELTIEDSIMLQTYKGLFGTKHSLQEAIVAGKEGILPNWIWESDEETQLTFIGALYGTHNEVTEINYEAANKYLFELQIICRNLGIHIDSKGIHFNPSELEKIKSIEHMRKEDVYCCKVESDEHLWVCNGIITHNCSEILLPDNEEESFVCDLSSMNILYYDEWKDTDAVKLLAYLLDAVMTDFINKAKDIPYMDKAVRFAENHRALGIGWLGWHSYLQSKMIPFESMEAKLLNVQVGKKINESAWEASRELAEIFGEPSVLKGYGRRNTTLTAIAPTKSSSWILGQASEGVEPIRSNYCIKDLQKGKFTLRNIYLEQLLESKGQNTHEVWDSILKNSGSVQHLSFLSDLEKNVFKTFIEISPKEVIIQAAQRQKYIDQGQSLNLVIDPKVPTKDLNALMIEAWKLGVKTLYYQIGVNAAQQLSRSILSCESCGA